jgi:hypothetical protein
MSSKQEQLQELVNTAKEAFTNLEVDANSVITKGNKAAGTRVRKNSMVIINALKEARKKISEIKAEA